jgi:hypothetical protein
MPNLDGMDCSSNCTHLASNIKGKAAFVGRYYRWPKSKYAPLTYAEAQALSAEGLSIVALWEWASAQITNFSYHEGFDQGSSAYKQAMNAHQPAGTPIYFAVDNDFSNVQIAGPINDYFRGVKDAFAGISNGNSAYLTGVYGSGRACSWLLNHGNVARTWLAMSTGWSGYNTFNDWDIKQGDADLNITGLTYAKDGKGDYDSDEAKSTFGGFTV